MENITEPQAAKTVKSIERSAAYPAITIEEALKFVSEVYKNFRNDFTKRDDILSLVENAQQRYVAASAYYGFLKREKDTYQVSDLYKQAASPINEAEKRVALLKAFSSPKLNNELIIKFDGYVLPDELKIHLYRFYRITEDAAPLAAEVFISNAKFVGVLSEDNVLRVSQLPAKSELDILEQEEPNNNSIQNLKRDNQPILNNSSSKIPLLEEMTNSDKIRIRLTGGKFAYLIHPLDLNTKDIAILQKQIEQLQLIAEAK